MFFSGRSKQLPYLSDYLANSAKQGKQDFKFVSVIATLTCLVAVGIFAITTRSFPIVVGLAGVAGVGAITAFLAHSARQKSLMADPDLRLFEEAREASGKFQTALMQRKLHRVLHPSIADLLEASARNWKRTRDAVDSEFWTSKDLPDHWTAIRDRASRSADLAMAEIMVLMRGEIQPEAQPVDWQDSVIGALQSIGLDVGKTEPGFDHLPIEFESARQISERLAKLANEMETASREILQTSDFRTRLSSTTTIDDTLRDLRDIQTAENELRSK